MRLHLLGRAWLGGLSLESLHVQEGVSSAPTTRVARDAPGHAVAHVLWALADNGANVVQYTPNSSLQDHGMGGKWEDDAERRPTLWYVGVRQRGQKREASSKSNEHHKTGTNKKKRGPRPANRRYAISSVSLAEPNSPCHILVWRPLLSAVALIRTAHARAGR